MTGVEVAAAYLLGAIDVYHHEGYEEYRSQTGLLLRGLDGVQILSADDLPVVLEGGQPADHLFVVRFETMELLLDFYHSAAYDAIKHHRTKSSATRFIMAMRGFAP